jgi:hypothetical protein
LYAFFLNRTVHGEELRNCAKKIEGSSPVAYLFNIKYFIMREENKGFSESKLENKKNKINAIRVNIKAKNNSEGQEQFRR